MAGCYPTEGVLSDGALVTSLGLTSETGKISTAQLPERAGLRGTARVGRARGQGEAGRKPKTSAAVSSLPPVLDRRVLRLLVPEAGGKALSPQSPKRASACCVGVTSLEALCRSVLTSVHQSLF